jgi:transposase
MLVAWSEMPRSPGHVFYDRLQAELVAGGFDGFAEGLCVAYYAARRGRPSLPPGRYFRMLLMWTTLKASIALERGRRASPALPSRSCRRVAC